MLSILSHCTPEVIRSYDFDTFFGTSAHSRSISVRRETLESRAANLETNVVLAATDDQRIAGFGVLAPPVPDDRWSQMQAGVIMAVEMVEMHNRFRGSRIAGDMVRLMLAHTRTNRQ